MSSFKSLNKYVGVFFTTANLVKISAIIFAIKT